MKLQIFDKTDEEVNEMLRHIEHAQLKAFTAQYAYLHTSFKKDIIMFFNPQHQGKSIAAYRAIVSGFFQFDRPGRYSRGYDFYATASQAANDLDSLLEKSAYFISKNNFEEAAAIAQSIIETIPRNYEMVDDSDGELGDTFNEAIGLLLQIAEKEKAGTELKKEIFHWVGKEVKESIYSDYGFDEIHSLLIPYTRAAGLYEEALLIADERIALTANDYRLERAVNDKIRLLQQNNRIAEAESVIDSYMGLVSIRKMRINKMLEDKRYGEAINLIEEGIKIAEKEAHPGTVSDWKDQLLELYILMTDHSNILKYAEDLFYNGPNAMKYYQILKTEKDTKEWAAYLDTLLSRRKSADWFGHTDNVLANIYIEEQYWERLLQLVEKSELSRIEAYEQYLKPRVPDKLRDIFVEKLMPYADRNVGRNHYQYVAGILRKIRTYPEGNRIVDKLLTEFKIKYKARRAMMEELKGV